MRAKEGHVHLTCAREREHEALTVQHKPCVTSGFTALSLHRHRCGERRGANTDSLSGVGFPKVEMTRDRRCKKIDMKINEM